MKTRMIIALAAVLSLMLGITAMAANPVVYDNWTAGSAAAECSQIGTYAFGYKVNLAPNGSWTHEGNTITIYGSNGSVFNWSATSGIGAVIVKAGTGANVWFYDPQAMGDTGLYGYEDKEVSHVTFCWNGPADYEELTVSKTAVTAFTRTHKWDIDKRVETDNGITLDDGTPKIWLYINGSGDEMATWTVDVTYEGYEDSGWNVSGSIIIENTGTLDAVITSIVDKLAGKEISIDCGSFDGTLPAGDTLTCTYNENVASKVTGNNVVTVTTERDTYSASAAISWGAPTTEVNKTVNVVDNGTPLGSVTAPDGKTFTYTKDFAWAHYGVGSTRGYTYKNTATIVETEQSASATLKVNVQGYIWETAYAMGAGAKCFIDYGFGNWGWTNPLPQANPMPLWAGAGQCDTSKGTLVGTTDDWGNITLNSPYYLLRKTHVYRGTTMFPLDRKGRQTVAPGQYYIEDGATWVIVHAEVGIPDPNFGP